MKASEGTIAYIPVCPECESTKPVKDHQTGEIACRVCGRVIREESFDRGPQWLSDEDGAGKRERGGPPLTGTIHDRGLSTQVSYSNRDGHGKALSPSQLSRTYRLRNWHKKIQVSGTKEKNLARAFSELNRMSSQLGVPKSVQEGAAEIYREAVKMDLVRGRTIEGMGAAALSLECRRAGVPRTLAEIAEATCADVSEISRNRRTIERELGIRSEPLNPADLVSQIGCELDLSGETRANAIDLLRKARDRGLTSGRKPSGMAAGALYIACSASGEYRTQGEIAEAADVTDVTVRSRYKEIAEELDVDA